MTTTDTLPGRYCTARATLPVTFELEVDTETDLGLSVLKVITNEPTFLLSWLDGALDVAFTLANARADDLPNQISLTAHIARDDIEEGSIETRHMDTDGNPVTPPTFTTTD